MRGVRGRVDAEHGEAEGLRRGLRLWSVTLSGVGIVLGAGIYVLVGEAAAETGSSAWLAFFLAAMLAGLTGLSFAELASMYPEAGASAVYAREAFGERVGFVTGWLTIAVTVTGAAAVALGFAGYLHGFLPLPEVLLAVGTIAVCAGIVCFGVRETIGLAAVFAALEAAGLVLVVVLGAPFLPDSVPLEFTHGWQGVVAGAAIVFFAYQGFEGIATLAEEVREPRRTIPHAMLIALAVTSVCYVVVALVATAVVPWEQLSEASAPLALVVETASNERMADVLSAIALFATFNTVLLLLATGARLTYGMAKRELLPRQLARVGGRGTPWLAALLVAGIAGAAVFAGDIALVAQVTNFAVFGQFLAVNGAVIVLRRREPERERAFRLPLAVGGVPASAVVGAGATAAFAVFMDVEALLAGAVVLAVGVVVSFASLHGDSGR